ncbi:hypothetical protein GCM10009789_33480 [Kribbella sancticallisti]|uniref:Peptidase C39-like domain-containing protein n=1 Tax=Kribbella sancticallisti TaxID=460087 RepID=A0ABP4PDN1_9ACTN
MPTATRGAAGLILLGALLAQAPLAAAYRPSDPETAGRARPQTAAPTTVSTTAPTTALSTAPSTAPTTAPTETPTIAPEPDPTAPPAAHSWSELVQNVIATAPNSSMLRATALADQSKQVMRCFKLEAENYCLGLGFVDHLPTGAEISAAATAPEVSAESGTEAANGESEQAIATGALTPGEFVTERSTLSDGARLKAELDEMQSAWEGRAKAKALRELDATQPSEQQAAPDTGQTATPSATPKPSTSPSTPTPPTTTPQPPASPKPPTAAPVRLPSSSYIMKGFQTSQDRGYWCGPATFQSIDWADDKQKDTQASWAKDLGATTSGTAITAMVKQTNLKTNWDLAAGTYIVQNVGHWNTQKFFTVHQNHLGDGKPAPIIEHTQLLKRYFPYLAFNHSGHYQVGRGYDAKKGTIAIFEVFNERRFNSRGNVTDGPKNIPASALFNATLANSFKNIGL